MGKTALVKLRRVKADQFEQLIMVNGIDFVNYCQFLSGK